MTLQSCLRGTKKPIAIIPVYIGYERMFEGKSYINELRGGEKKKESFGQLLGIRKTLKQAFGKVYLNFAEPLHLNEYLDEKQPDWHQYKGQVGAKPNWLTPQVNHLSYVLMEKINASVTLNSVSLIALVLLSTDRAALGRVELERQLDVLIDLHKSAKFSDKTYLQSESSSELIQQALDLRTIFSVDNPMGDIITTDEKTAVLLTYYRNNILHIYITSALIASCFLNQQSMTQAALIKSLMKLYPLLKKELFFHWQESNYRQHIEQNIEVFIQKGMLSRQAKTLIRPDESEEGFNQLFTHAQIARPTLLRYGIILTILSAQASTENLSRKALETKSQQLAQRIAALHSLNAPEAFDKNLFKNTVTVLRDEGFIKVSEDNNFVISPELVNLQETILDKINIHTKQLLLKTASWASRQWEEK